jgi:hypothetical protein
MLSVLRTDVEQTVTGAERTVTSAKLSVTGVGRRIKMSL